LALIPCQPGFFDTAAMKFTANLLKLAGKPGFVVYSRVDGRAAKWRLDDITEALESFNLTPAPVIMHQLDAYRDGIPAGLAAQEYEPKGKAAAEAIKLYDWLKSVISKTAK
jgi:chromosome partitioning protein